MASLVVDGADTTPIMRKAAGVRERAPKAPCYFVILGRELRLGSCQDVAKLDAAYQTNVRFPWCDILPC